jgi:putative restriction endonuclease
LREDLQTLFDRGYLTVTSDLHIEVSQRIKQDYGNGKEYYAMHGRKLLVLTENVVDRPSREFVEWHNENEFGFYYMLKKLTTNVVFSDIKSYNIHGGVF